MPCHPARARELLRKGRAVVARLVPFTIRLKDRTQSPHTSSSPKPPDAAPTPAPHPTGTDSPACGAPVQSSTLDTSPETSSAPSCRPASGRARGRDGSPFAPEGSTASLRRPDGSTSPTGICGSCSAATGTATTPGQNPRRRHLEKPVDWVPTAS
ncbi:RRXRR domain-containing protein [Streptomyces cynarae]|uniref:RRXRR domain-containing protein n=1 Tax=Streptomyces cynarae TaxID=2981134 RepID=UPI00406BE760